MTERQTGRILLSMAAFAVLCSMVAGACGKDEGGGSAAVTVRMGEYYYQPAQMTVPKDAKVTLVNDGALVHNWILKEAGVGTGRVAPGQSAVLDLDGVPPGNYMVYCDEPGHVAAGQTGTLTITA
jgi:plastocyanin